MIDFTGTGIGQSDLDDWVEYRKSFGKKRFTAQMQKKFLQRCQQLQSEGFDVPGCISYVIQIDRGWLALYGRDDLKRPKRQRDTTVTDLHLVERSDPESAAAGIAAMRRAARGEK